VIFAPPIRQKVNSKQLPRHLNTGLTFIALIYSYQQPAIQTCVRLSASIL